MILDILQGTKIKQFSIPSDLSFHAFEQAAEYINLKDDNFLLYVHKSLYVEALGIVATYLTLIESDKKVKELVKILENADRDDWILKYNKQTVFSPGA